MQSGPVDHTSQQAASAVRSTVKPTRDPVLPTCAKSRPPTEPRPSRRTPGPGCRRPRPAASHAPDGARPIGLCRTARVRLGTSPVADVDGASTQRRPAGRDEIAARCGVRGQVFRCAPHSGSAGAHGGCELGSHTAGLWQARCGQKRGCPAWPDLHAPITPRRPPSSTPCQWARMTMDSMSDRSGHASGPLPAQWAPDARTLARPRPWPAATAARSVQRRWPAGTPWRFDTRSAIRAWPERIGRCTRTSLADARSRHREGIGLLLRD